ncbi:MAG: aminotransferase class I/II-fold pyridoxal phosphate-dependent enzyme [Nocardioides sp.]|jgi:cystathionine beta-lyase
MIRDFTDAEARRALVLKWGACEPDVLPAWVAEMDYALAPCVQESLVQAITEGVTGYPAFMDPEFGGAGAALGEAYAGWARRQFGFDVDPGHVLPVADVTAGVRLALDVFSEQAPVVFPLPGYPPQHDIAQITGRARVDLILDPAAERAEFDLDALDRLFADGARTLLLTQPHNPWGRVFTRAELEGIRDVVLRHGARVISDEIHAPLTLGGAKHLSYLQIEGTDDHAVVVTAASKAFNTAGLKCAQLVTTSPAAAQALRDVPMARNDSYSPLGVIAATAAFTDGDEWLDALRSRLTSQRDLLAALLAEHLPLARMRLPEATYLAWIDLRAYADEPSALGLSKGRVWVQDGRMFQRDLPGHVRLNFATSPERLTEIVRRLARALDVRP